MEKGIGNWLDISYMDRLSEGSGWLYRLDPRAKLITTLAFIVAVISFDKYAVSALVPFFIYPAVMISAGGLPARYLLRKIVLVSPFVLLAGIFNPFFDRGELFHIYGFCVYGGWVSFISIILRFVLTVSAALVLISLSGFNAVCMALMKFKLPKPFVLQLLLLWRYVSVLTSEFERMQRASSLRSAGGNNMSIHVFIPLAGTLLLRSFGRAERIYAAMRCRGFNGDIRIQRLMKIGRPEVFFMAGWICFFIAARSCDLSLKLGTFVTGIFK